MFWSILVYNLGFIWNAKILILQLNIKYTVLPATVISKNAGFCGKKAPHYPMHLFAGVLAN